MKIQTEPRDDHQVKILAEIESEKLEDAKRRAGRKIAKRIKIPGFRPGKAPYQVVARTVGEGAILEEALDLMLEEIYPDIIEEADIDPYGPGSLEKVESMEPPVFEFTVPLAPEITLGNYRDIRIDYEPTEVTEDDINELIERLRDQQAVLESVERPAEEGDMVYIVLNGERAEPDEEGNTDIIKDRRLPVIIEKEDVDDKDEWPFPGFSRQLIGLSAEDEKEFDYTYPEDSEFEDLQSVTAKFTVKVDEIKSRSLPEVDDEFAKSAGDFENIEALRQQIEENLKAQYQEDSESEYNASIIDKMLEDAEIKYPPQMLDHEIDHALQDFARNLSSQGMDLDTYLKSRGQEIDELREEIRPATEERMRRSLVLMEAGVAEKIKIQPEEVDELTQERIGQLARYLTPEQAKQYFTQETMQIMVRNIITEEMSNRTLARLRAIARGEEIPEEAAEAETEDPAAESTTPQPEDSAAVEEAAEAVSEEAKVAEAETTETEEEADSEAESEDSTAPEEDVEETDKSE
ncbi:MAG: trigger factor [Anaerolineales bacterium]|nr:trigger factor [Anaerolineales bacterium]